MIVRSFKLLLVIYRLNLDRFAIFKANIRSYYFLFVRYVIRLFILVVGICEIYIFKLVVVLVLLV